MLTHAKRTEHTTHTIGLKNKNQHFLVESKQTGQKGQESKESDLKTQNKTNPCAESTGVKQTKYSETQVQHMGVGEDGILTGRKREFRQNKTGNCQLKHDKGKMTLGTKH